MLTGQVVARLIEDGVALPGAIGTFCGSIASLGGDSSYVAPALSGDPVGSGPISITERLPYFKGASEQDPLVIPANSPAMLKRFPPTLLISGTRDFAMSSVLQSQRLLTNAGVETDLHVWDGMWHSFFSDPELPESKEAYAVMVGFFDKHLENRHAAGSFCPATEPVPHQQARPTLSPSHAVFFPWPSSSPAAPDTWAKP